MRFIKFGTVTDVNSYASVAVNTLREVFGEQVFDTLFSAFVGGLSIYEDFYVAVPEAKKEHVHGIVKIDAEKVKNFKSAYALYEWNAEEGLHGTLYAYKAGDGMQLNNKSRPAAYIASDTATRAEMNKIVATISANATSGRELTLYTSDEPYNIDAAAPKNPTNGKKYDTLVATAGNDLVWNLSGKDRFFAIVLENASGATIVDSVSIEYEGDTDGEEGQKKDFARTVIAFANTRSGVVQAQKIFAEKFGTIAPEDTEEETYHREGGGFNTSQGTTDQTDDTTHHVEGNGTAHGNTTGRNTGNNNGTVTEKFNPVMTSTGKTSGVTESVASSENDTNNESNTETYSTETGNDNRKGKTSSQTDTDMYSTEIGTTKKRSEKWRDVIEVPAIAAGVRSPAAKLLNDFGMLLVPPWEYDEETGTW